MSFKHSKLLHKIFFVVCIGELHRETCGETCGEMEISGGVEDFCLNPIQYCLNNSNM